MLKFILITFLILLTASKLNCTPVSHSFTQNATLVLDKILIMANETTTQTVQVRSSNPLSDLGELIQKYMTIMPLEMIQQLNEILESLKDNIFLIESNQNKLLDIIGKIIEKTNRVDEQNIRNNEEIRNLKQTVTAILVNRRP